MGTGVDTVLAVCDGGNDSLAAVVIIAAAVLYFIAALTPVARAKDPTERAVLLALLIGSAVLGGFIFLGVAELMRDDYLAGLPLSLAIAALAGIGVAQTRRTSPGRAIYVALVGDAFVPGGLAVLLFAGFVIGSGCFD